jgi:hypothetical protein
LEATIAAILGLYTVDNPLFLLFFYYAVPNILRLQPSYDHGTCEACQSYLEYLHYRQLDRDSHSFLPT